MDRTELLHNLPHLHQLARADVWAVREAEVEEQVLALVASVRYWLTALVYELKRSAQCWLAIRRHLVCHCGVGTNEVSGVHANAATGWPPHNRTLRLLTLTDEIPVCQHACTTPNQHSQAGPRHRLRSHTEQPHHPQSVSGLSHIGMRTHKCVPHAQEARLEPRPHPLQPCARIAVSWTSNAEARRRFAGGRHLARQPPR